MPEVSQPKSKPEPKPEAKPHTPAKPKATKSVLSPHTIERGFDQPMVSRCRCGWRREGVARDVIAAHARHRKRCPGCASRTAIYGL